MAQGTGPTGLYTAPHPAPPSPTPPTTALCVQQCVIGRALEASLSPGGGGGAVLTAGGEGSWGFLEEEEGDGVPGLNREEEVPGIPKGGGRMEGC